MSCTGCATKFSLFLKQHDCPSCKFSFCSKCLKQKTAFQGKEQKVCKNCYTKLTNIESGSQPVLDPPALLLKRLESLENPAKAPITLYRKDHNLTSLKQGLSSQDKEIVERLERLKERNQPKHVTEKEILERLAILQGRNIKGNEQESNLPKPDTRTQQEKVDNLLQQYMEETNLNADKPINLEEIEKRLQKLKGLDGATSQKHSTPSEDSDEDDETAAAKLIKKALEEAESEKRLGITEEFKEEPMDEASDETEFPWCSICNEDAVVRCLGCDSSLYCRSCFKEGHDYFEMKEHKTVLYVAKDNK